MKASPATSPTSTILAINPIPTSPVVVQNQLAQWQLAVQLAQYQLAQWQLALKLAQQHIPSEYN